MIVGFLTFHLLQTLVCSKVYEVDVLIVNDTVESDNFGLSIDNYNDYVVVGSMFAGGYVFKYNQSSGTFNQISHLGETNYTGDNDLDMAVSISSKYIELIKLVKVK